MVKSTANYRYGVNAAPIAARRQCRTALVFLAGAAAVGGSMLYGHRQEDAEREAVTARQRFDARIDGALTLTSDTTSALGKLPASQTIGYPFLVCDTGLPSRLPAVRARCGQYKTGPGARYERVDVRYGSNNAARGPVQVPRSVVLEKREVFSLASYRYATVQYGRRVAYPRFRTEVWVVDVQDGAVTAHGRFVDDPLPPAFGVESDGGAPAIKEQAAKTAARIETWLSALPDSSGNK